MCDDKPIYTFTKQNNDNKRILTSSAEKEVVNQANAIDKTKFTEITGIERPIVFQSAKLHNCHVSYSGKASEFGNCTSASDYSSMI